MGTDYNEIICTAIDTIVSSKIEQLQYDVTKVCLIDDDSMAAQGKYVVADGAAKYEAFTNDTSLRKGNSVQVLIPNGDYNMQKTIISRIAANDTTPYNYTSPMDSMVKITNNVFLGVPITGLLANENSPQGDTNVSTSTLIFEISNLQDLSGYTKMGLEVDFRTWLPSDTVSGTYGIQLRIIGQDNREYEVQPFTNNEMYGNPYQYIDNFTQEIVYDISHVDSIKSIQAFLFQDGKFKNDQDEYIPWQEEFDGEIIKSSKNIFVDDLRIYFGYGKNELSDNFIQIYCSEGLLFGGDIEESNLRNLYARWFHKNENGDFDLLSKNIIQKDVYEIRWFEYTGSMNYIDDIYYSEAGLGWHLVQDYDVSNPFSYSFIVDSNKKSRTYKAICYEYFDYGTSDSEKKSGNHFISNSLVFTNRQEIADQATITANNALTIKCLDGSEGNYFLYNSLGQIIRSELGKNTTRYLQASFSDKFLKNYKKVTGVRWILPSENTMLDFEDIKENLSFRVDDITITGTLSNDVFSLNLSGVKDDLEIDLVNGKTKFLSYLKLPYSIKNQQSYNLTDNTINCEIELDGTTFYSVKQFLFGRVVSESNGLSLSLNFEDNKTALVAQNGATIEVKANLYYFGNEEQFYFSKTDNVEDTIKWEWYKQYEDEETTTHVKFQEGITEKQSSISIGFSGDNVPEKYCSILKATFSRNYSNGTPYHIVAYLPIPLRASEDYINLDGATEVIYETSGKPIYMTTPYNLTVGNIDEKFKYSPMYIKESEYLPKLSYGMDGASQALKATNLNIKIEEDRMSILVKNEEDNIVWNQPILIQQNQSDQQQSTEKSWNEDILIGNSKIKITNTSLGQGSATEDGKISGIFIGDKAETINEQETLNTGIYGIKLDSLAYYLNEDGDFYFYSDKIKIAPKDENEILKINESYFDSMGKLFGNVEGNFKGTLNGAISDGTNSFNAGQIAELKTTLETSNNTISSLQGTISTLNATIADLERRLKALEDA